jgi:Carboxypeptidase regulatory-like domain/TonB-dependent Receptor Plug Domain/TonB dependent receptor
MNMKSVLATAALTLGFLGSAFAQAPTATLVGTVRDTQRAVIVGAEINLRDLNTNAVRIAKTDAQGQYTLSGLDPSSYDVIISKDTFREVENPSVTLQAMQTARFDATLQIGSVSQEVVVTTEVGVLNSENGEKGDVIAAVEIAEMPLDGRDFSDLVFNIAGVVPAEEGSKGSPYVAGGVRSDATNIIVDGMNNTNPRDSSAEAAPPLDSLQEVKVSTSGYSAEYGRVAGPVVSMVIKKGGNTVHGSFFEYVRNDLFDGNNYFDVPGTHSELRRNQFGATVGGPVYIPHIYNGHNKTFFLISAESFREVQGSNSITVVPSLEERQGNFNDSINTFNSTKLPANSLIDPLGQVTLTNNQLPPSLWGPISKQLFNFLPLPNYTQNSASGFGNNYITNQKSYDNWDNVVVKLDQQLRSHDEASVRWLYKKDTSKDPFSGSELGLWGSIQHKAETILGVTETHIFNPNLINEFRSGLTRNVSNEHPLDAGTNWAAVLGIPGATNDLSMAQFPTLNISGYMTLGDSSQQPVVYTTNNFDTNDTLTWNHGKHTAKFGASVLSIQYYQPTNSAFSGTISFNGRNSAPAAGKNGGNALAEFLRGTPSSSSLRAGTVVNHIIDKDFAGFAQDDYKILDRLTLNVGLRYELQMMPTEKNGQFSSFNPNLMNSTGSPGVLVLASEDTIGGDAGLQGILNKYGVGPLSPKQSGNIYPYITTAAAAGLPQTLVNRNYLRFAPRVGWAWRPSINNSLVVRGSYGIFYTGSRLSALRTELTGNFPYAISQSYSGLKGLPMNMAFTLPPGTKTTSVNGYDPNAPSSYLESYNLTLEKELPKGLAVEVAYTGSRGIHLGWQVDINQGNPNAGPMSGSSYPRPFNFFAGARVFEFNAFSNYSAGTITVRKRFEHGLLFRANYTWAKNLDMNSALNYAGKGGYQGAQDSTNQKVEYGRSDNDRRMVFNGNFVYALPFNRNFVVKGWQMAGSWQADSGTPFTPQYSGPSQTDGLATRPNRMCNGGLPTSQRTVAQFFNTDQTSPNACFTQPTGLAGNYFGTSRRNILDGPGLYTVNWSLSRNFRITDSGKLQFRWELFNLLNHPNFKLPNDNMDEASVGSITSAGAPRSMQLGAKYTF